METVAPLRKVRSDKGKKRGPYRPRAARPVNPEPARPRGPFCNIAGQKFGLLTALEPTSRRVGHSVVWKFVCDCGTESEKCLRQLREMVRYDAEKVSCGCAHKGLNNPLTHDLTGIRYGKLVASKYVRPEGAGKQHNFWLWKCDCGGEVIARAKDVKRGNTKSCGCAIHSPKKHAGPIEVGDRFYLLTVLREVPANGCRRFVCRCDCGGETEVRAAILRNGQVRSCGCFRNWSPSERRAYAANGVLPDWYPKPGVLKRLKTSIAGFLRRMK